MDLTKPDRENVNWIELAYDCLQQEKLVAYICVETSVLFVLGQLASQHVCQLIIYRIFPNTDSEIEDQANGPIYVGQDCSLTLYFNKDYLACCINILAMNLEFIVKLQGRRITILFSAKR